MNIVYILYKREKFEILTFGGTEGGVALDFLPPRKDFDLADLELETKKKDDSSDSSDSEWDRGSISGKRSHISGNPASRRSIEENSSKKILENRSSLSTPPASETSKKQPDNVSVGKGSVTKQPSSARAKKEESSSSSSSSSDSEVN